MRVSKTERNCPICGTSFTPKTINSRYCSEKCSRKAYKRKIAEEKRQQELNAIADSVPDNRPYISVPEAIAIYGVAKSTLYRLIRQGHIPAINLGTRLLRIDRQKLESIFPIRQEQKKEESQPMLFDLSLENCYTISEVAEKYNLSIPTVSNHIRKHGIPMRHQGKSIYVPKTEIHKLYKQHPI
jgi:excisionase family DNA binding protein